MAYNLQTIYKPKLALNRLAVLKSKELLFPKRDKKKTSYVNVELCIIKK
jgi:hypothetical protein